MYAYRDSSPLIVKRVIDSNEQDRLQAFLDQRLVHPHIVCMELIDRETSAAFYYAMPKSTAVAANLLKPISDTVSAKLLGDMISALEFLHSAKFCHMDVKIDNIGVDAAGNFTLLDLGSICVVGGLTDVTEMYIPTHFTIDRGQMKADPVVDYWGLAITLIKLRGGSSTSRYTKEEVISTLAGYALKGFRAVSALSSKLV